jgi:molybdenum cofactor cytidylyltransferase
LSTIGTKTTNSFVAVVPASGRSSRFGSDKRRALIDGVPMLERVTTMLERAGAARVLVVDDNPDPDRGMFSTIQIGLARANDAADVARGVIVVHPADMPYVRDDTIRAVVAECARSGRPVCPRFNAERGHPLALPPSAIGALLVIDPHTPLNDALAALGMTRVELDVDDAGVLRDVDRPEDVRR